MEALAGTGARRLDVLSQDDGPRFDGSLPAREMQRLPRLERLNEANEVGQHLLAASASGRDEPVGWVSQEPTADNPWPDGSCYACDEYLEATGGEWTEENMPFADIRLVCHRCYDEIRAGNDVDDDVWPTFDLGPPRSQADRA